ncbi:histidinol phosphatase [Paludisphaera mucosa]|uniref:Histidinol phosphatase n=1 Tax=Paludisphaera mucosa TaxID=3030827 RepID=A0ABT6FIW9_9BACT|nr:histidinol phosphatase [Paludisphaera mucosa]MDG3007533.1 histidinol phosphatase [Paludisphaera mucosa]
MHATKRLYWIAIAIATVVGGAAPPGLKRSPVERMATERLKATHDDVRAIRASRKPVEPSPGLIDHRAIFHAHAEDSAHTGGTRPEMLAEAKLAGVAAIFLSDHHRPPRDFFLDSWRGPRDGVLFVPGSEARGFLLCPTKSVLDKMEGPPSALLEAVRLDGGLAFLSHVEERPDHDMANLDGMEIYNRHADAKKDLAGVASLVLRLTDPAALRVLEDDLRRYPDELFGAQLTYPDDYLAKWDRETRAKRLTGVAANDCHHNQILIVKMVDPETVLVGTNVDRDDQMRRVSAKLRPGLREMTRGRAAGDVLARVDLDPYHRSFANVSTHLLAPEATESALREALRRGRAYVSHDWMCDPTGFRFDLIAEGKPVASMGDEIPYKPAGRIEARSPVPCKLRLVEGGRIVAEATGDRLEVGIEAPGAYRVEGCLTLDGEDRGWVYTNPIYVRAAPAQP